MLTAQAPEWQGRVYADGGFALGRAVRDTATELAGPVESACRTFVLAADARIDNRSDFLGPLGLLALAANPISDARLMLLSFERWGVEVIGRFVGDFAVALWDRSSERLFLARDFVGQRPLHFFEGEGAVAVASMGSGIRSLEYVPRGGDEARVLEMLVGVPHEGRRTFLAGISRVEPGELISFGRGPSTSRIFWSPPADKIYFKSHADYAEAMLEKLDTAVQAQLRGASGTVGSHLSAGLDSSAVTTSAAMRFSGSVLAYTSVPAQQLPELPNGRFGNEGLLAAETARLHPSIEHRLVPIGERIPLEDLEREHQLFERPDLNLPNLVWSNSINDSAAAEGVRVMLVATMGNLTISHAGYERVGELVATRQIARLFAEYAAGLKWGLSARLLVGQVVRQLLPDPFLRASARIRHCARHPRVTGAFNPQAPGLAELLARFERNDDPTAASSVATRAGAIRRVDQGTYYKGVLLRWNIDVRDPTVDRRLVEFCLRVPLEHYFRNGIPRALIRTALQGRVPSPVLSERLRGLQSPHWFSMLSGARSEANQLFAGIEACEAARRVLNIEKMRRLLIDWPDRPGIAGPAVYRCGLLRGLSAGSFMRLYSGCSVPERSAAPLD